MMLSLPYLRYADIFAMMVVASLGVNATMIPSSDYTIIPYPFFGGASPDTAGNVGAGPGDFLEAIDLDMLAQQGWMLDEQLYPKPSDYDFHQYRHGLRNFDAVLSAYRTHFTTVARHVSHGRIPVSLGGDHSLATSSLLATLLIRTSKALIAHEIPVNDYVDRSRISDLLAQEDFTLLGWYIDSLVDRGHLRLHDLKLFLNSFYVFWADAHYDLNTPMFSYQGSQKQEAIYQPSVYLKFTSPSPTGHVHGMSAAFLSGCGALPFTHIYSRYCVLEPNHLMYFGVRDPDDDECRVVQQFHIPHYTMHDLETQGWSSRVAQAYIHCQEECASHSDYPLKIYWQCDVDVLDATYVPITGTPVGTGSLRNQAQGPSINQFCRAVWGALHHPNVVGVDIAELAYNLDREADARTVKSGLIVFMSMLACSYQDASELIDPSWWHGHYVCGTLSDFWAEFSHDIS